MLQCSDGEMILNSQFCDGVIDCADGSDEIRNRPGFKCVQIMDACSLPQRNLYDDVAQCADESDLCHLSDNSCFECLDKRLLISFKQVCDGVIDCYDLSDECLCKINLFYSPICNALFSTNSNTSNTFCTYIEKLNALISNSFDQTPNLVHALASENNADTTNSVKAAIGNVSETTKFCITKYGYSNAILCDGRPTCRDFSDECNCTNQPIFCNDTCRTFYDSFYPFGDHYCDGIEDEFAWEYLDQSACPRGFDEKMCPKRFNCKSGDKVSIDVSHICNGVVDCDDGEDEQNCAIISENEKLFSSATEMISNQVFRIGFWVIGLVVIFGNLMVIFKNGNHLRTAKLTSSLRCQNIIILNISIADLLMGIYLVTIAIFSQIYSGYYGTVDVIWRSSVRCSIVGSLAIISSEASCFCMVILTAYRLDSVCRPFENVTSPKWPWKISICVAWVISLTIGIFPALGQTSYYFVHSIFFPSEFNKAGTWTKNELSQFACRYAALTNQTIIDTGDQLQTTQQFLEKNFPQNTFTKFAYYSETSVCMPRIYVEKGENAWEYTFAIITINLLCFLFIALGYLFLVIEANNSSKKPSKFHKRIARIVATDFFCWIPICIMAYLRLSGVHFSNIVYQISAVFLLSINSALNPFLYSSLLDVLMKKFTMCKGSESTCTSVSA